MWDALYIFIFSSSINEYLFSKAIRSPLLAATLTVGTEIPRVAPKWVIVRPSSDAPQWQLRLRALTRSRDFPGPAILKEMTVSTVPVVKSYYEAGQ